jgi:hypothetical protein
MNTIVKSAVAGALALGATGAYAAGIGLPSSNNSDVILYVDALTSSGASAGVYALDTGISMSAMMPGTFVSNAANSTKFNVPNMTIAATTGLSSFLSSHSTNTINWTVEGGQYNIFATSASASKADNTNTVRPGDALVAFSSKAITGPGTSPNVYTAVAGNLQSYLNNYSADLGNTGGIHGLTSASETTGSEILGVQGKYGLIAGNDLSVAGTTTDFFGFTGNGSIGQVQSYLLGTASLATNGTLTLAGNAAPPPPPAVPLPAAVWLFGSGLMGLVGVSRRRKAAV